MDSPQPNKTTSYRQYHMTILLWLSFFLLVVLEAMFVSCFLFGIALLDQCAFFAFFLIYIVVYLTFPCVLYCLLFSFVLYVTLSILLFLFLPCVQGTFACNKVRLNWLSI